jgi:hypothetical protein
MAILIDYTKTRKGKRYNIEVCHYCNHDKYPHGKPIDSTTDLHARKTDKGNWKCGTCVAEESKDLLRLMRGVT